MPLPEAPDVSGARSDSTGLPDPNVPELMPELPPEEVWAEALAHASMKAAANIDEAGFISSPVVIGMTVQKACPCPDASGGVAVPRTDSD